MIAGNRTADCADHFAAAWCARCLRLHSSNWMTWSIAALGTAIAPSTRMNRRVVVDKKLVKISYLSFVPSSAIIPSRNTMKTSLLLCLATLLAAPFAFAADKAVDFPKAAALITFSLPDTWKVKYDEDGALMATPGKDDETVIVQVDELEVGLDSFDEAVKDAKETISEFKNLKYDEIQKGEKDGLALAIINAESENDDGKSFINLVLLAKPGAKNFILLSCISVKEGNDKHGPAIGAMIGSLKAK